MGSRIFTISIGKQLTLPGYYVGYWIRYSRDELDVFAKMIDLYVGLLFFCVPFPAHDPWGGPGTYLYCSLVEYLRGRSYKKGWTRR